MNDGNQTGLGALTARDVEGLRMTEVRERPRSIITFTRPMRKPVAGKATLLDCPPLRPGNYVLVRRDSRGLPTVLGTGRLVSETPSLNLALIRRRGAELGANEVHWLASSR